MPQTMQLESGLGAVQVMGTGGDDFYLRDCFNKQVASGALNSATGARPGEYTALLNSSAHTVFVEEGRLTRRGCGSVQVLGGTDEYYYVLDSAGKQLASTGLGKATALFPGAYTVKQQHHGIVRCQAGGTTTLQPGLIEVTGTTSQYYYVLDSVGAQRCSPAPGRSRSTTRRSRSRSNAVRRANRHADGPRRHQRVLLRPQRRGNPVGFRPTGQSDCLVPAAYRVKLNNSVAGVTIAAGQAAEVASGMVTAKKADSEYYHVLDDNGSQLTSAQVNQASALLPGRYGVRIGESKKPATVNAGKDTTLVW